MISLSGSYTPLISVIIATKNSVDCLPAALQSVKVQEGCSVECVVIDGCSTDGTQDIISSNSDIVGKWVSEKDDGIASAFNKGLSLASGELIYFLGADDVLYDNRVFADIITHLQFLPRPHFIYGDIYYSYHHGRKLVHRNYQWGKFRKYNCMPHQAMFLDRWFFERYGGFDARYKYAMDYEHISRFIEEFQPQYLERVIAVMGRYGTSSDVLPVHAEMDRVRRARGYAGNMQIYLDNLVLRFKLAVARYSGANW